MLDDICIISSLQVTDKTSSATYMLREFNYYIHVAGIFGEEINFANLL